MCLENKPSWKCMCITTRTHTHQVAALYILNVPPATDRREMWCVRKHRVAIKVHICRKKLNDPFCCRCAGGVKRCAVKSALVTGPSALVTRHVCIPQKRGSTHFLGSSTERGHLTFCYQTAEQDLKKRILQP